MRRVTVFSILFGAVLAVHIYAGEMGMTDLSNYSKPFILITLIAYFLIELAKQKGTAFGILILGGLAFSLFGDILLIFQDSGDFFIYGLGSFLVAHLLYIAAFTKTYLVNHEIKLLKKYGWVLLAVVGYAWFFFNAISDFLGSMIGPVLVYTMVISLMLLIALNRYRKVGQTSFVWIALGALFFVASDSLLAWNKFVRDLDHGHLLIMLTYGLAQYGIARGATAQLRDALAKSIPQQP